MITPRGAIRLCFALLFIAACSADPAEDGAPMAFDGTSLLPGETLRDAVSFSDFVLVVEVTDEREVEIDRVGGQTSDEYMTARTLSAEVTDVLWAGERFDEPAAKLELSTIGWWHGSDERRPLVTSEGPRLEVGRRYAVAVLKNQEGQWELLGNGTALEVVGSELHAVDGQNEFGSTLDGTTPSEAEGLLTDTAPYPETVPLSGESPYRRYNAVLKSDAGSTPTTVTPGPP